VRDLGDKDIRTKIRLRATGATHGGIPFERGSLFYLLRNQFYVGEVKYKGEILPGEQPAIMDRQLFDAVQQKLTDRWSHRNDAKSKSDHLLTGLLYDDAGHRMIPTHATKAGIRYRYYVSLPHLGRVQDYRRQPFALDEPDNPARSRTCAVARPLTPKKS
jgi:site-specific DNA recombinase